MKTFSPALARQVKERPKPDIAAAVRTIRKQVATECWKLAAGIETKWGKEYAATGDPKAAGASVGATEIMDAITDAFYEDVFSSSKRTTERTANRDEHWEKIR
jgi:hypothetical protein